MFGIQVFFLLYHVIFLIVKLHIKFDWQLTVSEVLSKQFFTYTPNSSMDQIVLSAYKWGNLNSERINNLSKIIHPVTGRLPEWTVFPRRVQERLFEGLFSSVSCSAPLFLCFWLLKTIGSSEMTTSGIHFHQIDGKFTENILKKKKSWVLLWL